jgi:hypothetical protein
MKSKNNIIKFISSVLLILIIVPTVLFSIPKKTYAQTVNVTTNPIIQANVSIAEGLDEALSLGGIPVDNPSDAAMQADIARFQANVAATTKAQEGPVGFEWLTKINNALNTMDATSSANSNLTNLGITLKNVAKEILRQALITMGHQLLVGITQDTVNWINSGFHGSPLFVQNSDQFFSNIAESEVKNIINQVGFDPNQPFGQQFALNLINQYKASSTRDMQYSLSQVTSNQTLLNNYRTNFASGGWNAFLINTQYPQNNYIGYTMQANQTLASQLAGQSQVKTLTQKAQTILSQGNGFLNPTMCPASINPNYNTMTNEFNPPTFNASAAQETAYGDVPACIPLTNTSAGCVNQADITAAENINANGGSAVVPQCTYDYSHGSSGACANQDKINAANAAGDQQYANLQASFKQTSSCIDPKTGKSALVATTPGAVVGNQIMSALNLKTGVAGLDAALGNSFSAILNALMNHFLQAGLSGISQAVQSEPPLDNWSYNGQTLSGTTSGTTTGTNATNPLTVPTNVSLSAGNTTSTQISGGTGPYSIVTQPNSTIATAQIDANGNLSVTGISQGTTTVTIQDSSSTNQAASAVPVAQINTITMGGSAGTAGTLTATINSVATSVLVTSNDTPTTAATSLTNAINANNNINKIVLATDTTPGTITITSQTPGTTGVFSLTSTNTTTALTATSTATTPASNGNPPNQTTTVTITVGTNGNILLNLNNSASNPANISVSVGTSMNLTLSSGTQPYNVQTQPDSTIALALINNNTLTVVGVAPGVTSLSLQDSLGKNINLSITVGNESPLTASPTSVSTNVSDTATATISGGTPPYTITTNSSDIASAVLSGNTLTVTGSSQGATSVTIQDSYSPAESITVPITIGASTITVPTLQTTPTTGTTTGTGQLAPGASLLGSCVYNNLTIPNVSQSSCTSLGGSRWNAN